MMKKIMYISLLLSISFSILGINYIEENKVRNPIVRISNTELKQLDEGVYFNLGEILIGKEDKKRPLKEISNLILNLSDNNLVAFPKGLEQLSNVIKLDLSKNSFTTLPDVIGDLKQLVELDMSDNKLTQLPATIGNLENLEKLDLSFNKLKELPAEINKLHSLGILNLVNNQLTSLPKISSLLSLEGLNLLENPLEEMPNLEDLISLLEIRFEASQLKEPFLLDELASLPSLKKINIYNDGNERFIQKISDVFKKPGLFSHIIRPDINNYYETSSNIPGLEFKEVQQKVDQTKKLFEKPMSEWYPQMAPIISENGYNVLDLTGRILKDITGIEQLRVWDFTESDRNNREKLISEVPNLYIRLNHTYAQNNPNLLVPPVHNDLPFNTTNKTALISFIQNADNLKKIDLPSLFKTDIKINKVLKNRLKQNICLNEHLTNPTLMKLAK